MEHFWLAAPLPGFADFSVTGDFRESENRRLLRESGLAIGRIGHASQFEITRGGRRSLTLPGARSESMESAPLPIEKNDGHEASGGNGGGVFRCSLGMESSGQSGTSSFSRTNSFR